MAKIQVENAVGRQVTALFEMLASLLGPQPRVAPARHPEGARDRVDPVVVRAAARRVIDGISAAAGSRRSLKPPQLHLEPRIVNERD